VVKFFSHGFKLIERISTDNKKV